MVLLEVQERDAARRPKHLRKEGFVPMALVEPGTGTRLIQASESEIRRVISNSSGVGMFELQVKGEKEKRTVIVKQLDQDVLRRELLNVTVMQITREQVLTSDIPVHSVGTPEPIKENQGVLISPTSHIKVKGRAMDLPSHVDIDVSGMQIGDSINVEAVKLPEGVELASSHDAVLFSLQPLRQEIEETPAVAEGEEGAEPALVGEEKEEGEKE